MTILAHHWSTQGASFQKYVFLIVLFRFLEMLELPSKIFSPEFVLFYSAGFVIILGSWLGSTLKS